MKAPIAAFSLTCLLMGQTAFAQAQQPPAPAPASGLGRPSSSTAPLTKGGPGKTDKSVYPASATLPEPVDRESLKPGTLVLPDNPIEPYLLTKDDGPFMVIAKTFKGIDAERYALALVLELRNDFGLPAFILRTKDFPMRSVMRNVPPLAPEFVRKPQLTDPERNRSTDEAAVLVGNEKTLADSVELLHRVKKIKPKCLEQMPTIFVWRTGKGLQNALRTTNPYVPVQNLFPGPRKDKLIVQMNEGPHSVMKCPGRYTLQIAEFSGRSIINPNLKEPRLMDASALKDSPLMTAMDDAEKLADKLNKDPELVRSGFRTYVYHDRTSSKVMVGAFNNPNDPTASKLRETLLTRREVPTQEKRPVGVGGWILSSVLHLTSGEWAKLEEQKNLGTKIAPASNLTDLEDPTRPIKNP
jgi:hypothetical protein